MEERKISPTRYTVVASPPQEVASYLSASDAGLAFIKPCFSKLASSPTKNAEYLACGLPIVINSDVGDSDALVTVEKVGRLVESFDQESYLKAIRGLQEDFGDVEHVRAHSRSVAERLFDVGGVGIDRYLRLYSDVLNAAPGPSPAQNSVNGTSDGASPAAARRF
jgi:glycosyltransferase involved in cell wall biosynthesis